MKHQYLMALEHSSDQARDAISQLLHDVSSAGPGGSMHNAHLLERAYREVLAAVPHLSAVEGLLSQLRCDRAPCDRSGGICPRCEQAAA